jgi:group I intron endonuclease
MIGVYSITNLADGKRYVGSSRNIEVRFYEHRWMLTSGRHHNIHLQRAWRKHGPAAFRFEVLIELGNESELLDAEQGFIDSMQAAIRGKGYNIKPRADCGTHSAETAARISRANKGRFGGEKNPFFGRQHSEATRATIRHKACGRRANQETRRKMSEAHAGERHHFYGRQFTDSERRMMSGAMAKLKKAVQQFDFSGCLVAEYESINEAARLTGLGESTIGKACKGVIKYAYGYFWKFKGAA